jgi:hypothetical protein
VKPFALHDRIVLFKVLGQVSYVVSVEFSELQRGLHLLRYELFPFFADLNHNMWFSVLRTGRKLQAVLNECECSVAKLYQFLEIFDCLDFCFQLFLFPQVQFDSGEQK